MIRNKLNLLQIPKTEALLDAMLIAAGVLVLLCAFMWVGALGVRHELVQLYRRIRYGKVKNKEDDDAIAWHEGA